jgi:protein-L-isoaspartate(D-aspartate) O-methyltransferase
MAHLDFISSIHNATKRNYVQRAVEYDKAECATVAKRFDREYFDGDRRYGYGGYRYDGRWVSFARQCIGHYQIKPSQRVLDIGCGKGFLLHDFKQLLPALEVAGLDVSSYAVENSLPDVKPFVQQGSAVSLPYPDGYFDLVLSINTLHNLRLHDLVPALREIERVGRQNKFIVLDGYRNEREKVNLLFWQLTCECFYTPEEWQWIFDQAGYSGDHDFVFFE